ncbi:ComEC/Rec2 family competence protein [Bifidobacterium sp. MA2]|uniref:ComEC/Rec2 family competence protein n=2 Tax=Bifidobacterium santillanense TaxID=2809028 RepID=A0ABS5ULV9_9BIFI|nr:ComEC/Rec2 family competence protein [Bifidobacterium santillanense]
MARAREGSGYLSLEGTVVEPVLVSSNRKADCQAEMRVQILDDGLVRVRSNADVRLFASGDDCSRIHRGAVYRASGTFAEAVIGTTPLWLTVHGEDGLVVLKEQPWPERCREHMQESFFRATEGLSDQGRVLVPGLTMGFLGQDHPSSSYDARPINDTYASQLEERFRTAGIMHLMAVSGGHFVIVSGLIRRICARLLVPRRIVAVLMVGCTSLLAALMAPGDSVSRALVMGWIGAAALYLGRRTQALSALCVTVIVMLLLDPALAWSYGFALSCASVLGIVMMSRPISGVAALILPDRLADAVAMTIAAQTATLPIQVMMEPQLPLWSLVANVLVSPVVDFATMAGLAGLAVAWANVDAAAVLAWVASWGTRVMERVAMWLGGGEHAVVPWAGGVRGAILLAAIETAVILTIVRIARLAGPSRAEHALPGEPFTRNPRNRLRIWWDDTMRMMRDLDAYRE